MTLQYVVRGRWEVEDGPGNEESLNSGLEGEWKLQQEEAAGTREFAMREWSRPAAADTPSPGEWQLQEQPAPAAPWPEPAATTSPGQGAGQVTSQGEARWRRRLCCCDHLTELKISITVFGLINLGIMAAGGVGFGLGLTNNHKEETFKYLMVGKQWLPCNLCPHQ